jgi:hypothetical protein
LRRRDNAKRPKCGTLSDNFQLSSKGKRSASAPGELVIELGLVAGGRNLKQQGCYEAASLKVRLNESLC